MSSSSLIGPSKVSGDEGLGFLAEPPFSLGAQYEKSILIIRQTTLGGRLLVLSLSLIFSCRILSVGSQAVITSYCSSHMIIVLLVLVFVYLELEAINRKGGAAILVTCTSTGEGVVRGN